MSAERPTLTRHTFAKRAISYNTESEWVTAGDLIDPLLAGLTARCRVLDVCSGTGTVAAEAMRAGHDVTAVDLSPEMLRRNPADKKLVGTGSRLPFPDGAFDRIICRQGLHYLDIEAALSEFRRASRSSVAIGTIVMKAETDREFWEEYFAIASPGRLHIFAPENVPAYLDAAGFDVDFLTYATSSGEVLAPVMHLDPSARRSVLSLFSDPEIVENYGVQGDGDHCSYEMLWEFTIGTRSAEAS